MRKTIYIMYSFLYFMGKKMLLPKEVRTSIVIHRDVLNALRIVKGLTGRKTYSDVIMFLIKFWYEMRDKNES